MGSPRTKILLIFLIFFEDRDRRRNAKIINLTRIIQETTQHTHSSLMWAKRPHVIDSHKDCRCNYCKKCGPAGRRKVENEEDIQYQLKTKLKKGEWIKVLKDRNPRDLVRMSKEYRYFANDVEYVLTDDGNFQKKNF